VITLEDVGKDVVLRDGQHLTLLDDVNLTLCAGEFVAVVGRSGSGKSTLLNLIGLLDTPTRGRICYEDKDISGCGDRELSQLRGQHLGFVFQQFNLLPALTAAENVSVPLLAAGVNRIDAVKEARRLLAQLGMEDRAEALPAQLSGGQQQRVALGRALIHKPRLVVCDEPTSALDAHTGHAVMELLSEVAVRPDRAVIVVTHDARVFEFADTIAHMDDGRIKEIETGAARAGNIAGLAEAAPSVN
jgi:putative ABC transport system ATP-binding protein